VLLGEIRAGDYIQIGQMGPQRESGTILAVFFRLRP